MLVLSRKRGESIQIADDVVVTIVQIGRGRVQLGIQAPPHVEVHRQEIARRLATAGAHEGDVRASSPAAQPPSPGPIRRSPRH